jgi:DNA-binding transcriptional LysR family regulator
MNIESWDDLRVLLAVHRTGSLLAAGKSLGLSTATVGRRIATLEAALGHSLVTRGRTGTSLEPAATRLIALARDLENGLAAERRDRPSIAATLRVSVPDGAVLAAAEALLAFRREYPETDIELIHENRMSDLAKREADIGLRITRSSSSVLVEKRVATLTFGIYASPEYVARYLPSSRLEPRDVGRHPFIGLDTRWRALPHERWMVSLGAKRFPFRSSSIVAILEAVRQGVGLAALVEHDARNAGLARIEVATRGPTQPLYLVFHRDLRKAPHVRGALRAFEAYVRSRFSN